MPFLVGNNDNTVKNRDYLQARGFYFYRIIREAGIRNVHNPLVTFECRYYFYYIFFTRDDYRFLSFVL